LTEEEEDRNGKLAGLWGCGVGLRQLGFGQVSVSLFFFSTDSFLLFTVSCFAISNTNLLTWFC
jgi:hypothetical protein